MGDRSGGKLEVLDGLKMWEIEVVVGVKLVEGQK